MSRRRARSAPEEGPGEGAELPNPKKAIVKLPKSVPPRAEDLDALLMNAIVASVACMDAVTLSMVMASYLQNTIPFRGGAEKAMYGLQQLVRRSFAAGSQFFLALAIKFPSGASTSTTRALSSGVTDATVPTPSTWPLTM